MLSEMPIAQAEKVLAALFDQYPPTNQHLLIRAMAALIEAGRPNDAAWVAWWLASLEGVVWQISSIGYEEKEKAVKAGHKS